MAYSQPFPLAQPVQKCRDPNPNIIEEFSSGDLGVDTRSEWRGDDPSRVGAASDPLMEGIEQLDTTIHSATRAASRFRDIASWCDQFSLPKTISDIAKQLYKRSDEEKLLRGKSLDAVIAACIFIACRQAHVPRTFREICTLTHVSKKTLASFQPYPGASGPMDRRLQNALTGPEDLLIRFCNHLDLPPNLQPICREIIIKARELGIADGRSPVKSARDISTVAGVSEGTIKLVYRLYYAEKERLVKEEWIADGKASLSRLPMDNSSK
ncbi:cyclin-like protein [Amylocystis lapponica]|nr:cyclin-like protein [Amylocystis lapponica]